MPRLDEALAVKRGGADAVKVVRNGTQIWPPSAPPTGAFALSATPLTAPSFPVTASGRGYVGADGKPFLGIADTLWNGISRMTRAEFTTYAQTRRTQGYTAVLLSVLDINSRTRTGAVSGTTPFTGSGNSAAFTSPNLTGTVSYWDQVEWCVDELAAHGLLAVLVPCWYGWQGNMWRGHIAETAADTTIAASYGAFLASRLGDRPNVWWLHGGDNGPTTANSQANGVPGGLPRVDVTAATNALASAIKTGATANQMATYHSYRNDAAGAYFNGQAWYEIHAAYSGDDPSPRVLAEWSRSPSRPTFTVEMYYARRGDVADQGTFVLDRRSVRAEAWQSVTSGALVTANGNEAVWPVRDWYSGWDWTHGVSDPSADDLTVMSRVFASFPGAQWTADHGSPLVTSNRGSGLTLAPGLRSVSGAAVVYLPDARTVTLDPEFSWEWVHTETATVEPVTSFTTPSGWADAILVGTK